MLCAGHLLNQAENWFRSLQKLVLWCSVVIVTKLRFAPLRGTGAPDSCWPWSWRSDFLSLNLQLCIVYGDHYEQFLALVWKMIMSGYRTGFTNTQWLTWKLACLGHQYGQIVCNPTNQFLLEYCNRSLKGRYFKIG